MGTMKEADRKAALRFSIGASIIIVVIALLCYNVIPSFAGEWHNNAKSWTKDFAFVFFAAALFWIYRANTFAVNEKSSDSFGFVALLLVALGICVSSGFVFDLK